MTTFSTEFPVSNKFTKAALAKMVVEWVAGIKNSTLLNTSDVNLYDDDDAQLIGDNGESLSLKHIELDHGFVTGARHSICDEDGREWRTEIVLTNKGKLATLKVTGQCLAIDQSIPVMRPKRPYLIKKALENGWGGRDGDLDVQPLPHYFGDSDIELAISIILGKSRLSLPVIYVSRDYYGGTAISVEKLAYDLGGVAHVVVEPSRDFSRILTERTGGRNPYFGNIGISTVPLGNFKRFYLGGSLPTKKALSGAVCNAVEMLVSNKSVMNGYDWIDLNEAHSKLLRSKIISKSRVDSSKIDDWIKEFQSEIDGYRQKILELERELQKRDELDILSMDVGYGIIPSSLSAKIGKELYDGEFSDRILFMISEFTRASSFPEHDVRTRNVASQMVRHCNYTGRATALRTELKRAANSGKKYGWEMRSILSNYNFTASEDGPHIKMSPPADDISGPTIPLPKTPSEIRGGQNQVRDISNALGLKNLRK
ncbi:hypothetical protein O5O51_09450 [Sinirhodobacter sp. HNIBRBA609]|nr:hypothetical protein O5O51_09450 [Sinirhodobacter sp. HNIBRBA609]